MTRHESPLNPIEAARRWKAAGLQVALATVVQTWGSAPRPVGSQMAINEKAEFSGSVSGGCIENFLISEALDVIEEGTPQLFEYGISDDEAREVRLACGGTIRVFVEPAVAPGLLDTLAGSTAVARVIDLTDGRWTMVGTSAEGGTLPLDAAAKKTAQRMLGEGQSGVLTGDSEGLMVVAHLPPRRMFVIGAVHIAQALVPMAVAAGFGVTVVDPRPAFSRSSRLPETDILSDPVDTAMEMLAPDSNTAVVALAHDPLLDDPALIAALNSPAYYIGCLGSKRTHAKRLERLRGAGLGEDLLARLHGPIGLDIGGRSPGEIAVSILAEVVAARYGKMVLS